MIGKWMAEKFLKMSDNDWCVNIEAVDNTVLTTSWKYWLHFCLEPLKFISRQNIIVNIR